MNHGNPSRPRTTHNATCRCKWQLLFYLENKSYVVIKSLNLQFKMWPKMDTTDCCKLYLLWSIGKPFKCNGQPPHTDVRDMNSSSETWIWVQTYRIRNGRFSAAYEDDYLLQTCSTASHETSKINWNTYSECCKNIYGMGSTVCVSVLETKQCKNTSHV
jgi:hypothetical protein